MPQYDFRSKEDFPPVGNQWGIYVDRQEDLAYFFDEEKGMYYLPSHEFDKQLNDFVHIYDDGTRVASKDPSNFRKPKPPGEESAFWDNVEVTWLGRLLKWCVEGLTKLFK